MKSGVVARALEPARNRPLQQLATAIVVAAVVAAASPLARAQTIPAETNAVPATAVQRAVESMTPKAPEPPTLVWEGADVDGDGQSDFANPTGQEPRGHDAYGEGAFRAARAGGARRHEGVDYRAEAGQAVVAPMSGQVTKIGCAYSGDQTLKFIEVTNPALRYAVRVFYVDPEVGVGDSVVRGAPIGTARSLQKKYPRGMTDHVHLEVLDQRGRHLDATRLITAEYVRPTAPPVQVALAD